MHQYIQGSFGRIAAGADINDPTSTGASFRLLTFRAQLVTSATVANRWPHFQFVTESGDVLHEIVPAAAQAAGATVVYDLCAATGASNDGSAVADGVSSLALPDLWFPANTHLNTKTTALDAGDQWSMIYWSADIGEEWEHLRWLEEIAANIGA